MTSLSQRTAAFVACLGVTLATLVVFSPPAHAADCEAESREEKIGQTPWPLARLQPERVWPLSRGEGVKVAVIDSGVGEHPILKGQVTAYDLTEDDLGARCDMASHGTLVAGIIAGLDTESSPFHGVAPDSHILSYRVIENMESSTSRESTIPVVNAINQAVDDGADVINLSLTAIHTIALEDAIERAYEAGVVVVAAAGNRGGSGNSKIEYPAAYDNVLAVAGIGEDGDHVDSSSIGDYVDVAAPGKAIDGPAPAGGGYGRRDEGGTSFAAPYVSATAALLKAYYPDAGPDEIAARIMATADHPPEGWNPVVGYGELNIYRAMTTILPEDVVEPPKPRAVAAPVAEIDSRAELRRNALLWTIGAAGIVLLALCAKLIVPRGRARGWSGR